MHLCWLKSDCINLNMISSRRWCSVAGRCIHAFASFLEWRMTLFRISPGCSTIPSMLDCCISECHFEWTHSSFTELGRIGRGVGHATAMGDILDIYSWCFLLPSWQQRHGPQITQSKTLHSSADSTAKDLQVDVAIADKATTIHNDSISSAERIDRCGGRALYCSESSFVFVLPIWEDYWYTVTALRSTFHLLLPPWPCALISGVGVKHIFFFTVKWVMAQLWAQFLFCACSPLPQSINVHTVLSGDSKLLLSE